jgi:hypothetical protein
MSFLFFEKYFAPYVSLGITKITTHDTLATHSRKYT